MKKKCVKKSSVRDKINALITVFLILAVLMCLFVAFQILTNGYVDLAGYSLFRVVTGSMEPTIPVGSLLLSRNVEISQVQEKDIICFRAQDSQIFGKMMTHRVVEVQTEADGSVSFVTKGDANLVSDGYFVTESEFVGKVIWYTGAGSILSAIVSFFTNKVGFLSCIVLPCLLLSALIFRDCIKNIRFELAVAKEELRQYEETNVLESMTDEEYDEMYARIRDELLEELMNCAEKQKKQLP